MFSFFVFVFFYTRATLYLTLQAYKATAINLDFAYKKVSSAAKLCLDEDFLKVIHDFSKTCCTHIAHLLLSNMYTAIYLQLKHY